MASLLLQKQSWADLPSQFETEEVSPLLMTAFWLWGQGLWYTSVFLGDTYGTRDDVVRGLGDCGADDD